MLTTEEFITRAKSIHGDYYDYSKVDYKGGRVPILVGCPKHGFFTMPSPGGHLSKNAIGCKACGYEKNADKKRKSVSEWIEQVSKIHKNFYDYSKVKEDSFMSGGNRAKVEIICPEHGVFIMSGLSHFQGHGCRKCGARNKSIKFSGVEKKLLKNKRTRNYNKGYTFNENSFKNIRSPLEGNCPEHGKFTITPGHFLYKKNPYYLCSSCNYRAGGNANSLTTEDFIWKSKSIHGDKFNYSKTEYESATKKLIITCPKHGDFKTIPSYHHYGWGCPECGLDMSRSIGEEMITEWLKKKNIEFVRQKTFEGLKGKRRKLKCDFYLPKINLVIEYNGEQHYRQVPQFGGKKIFLITQEYDRIKKQYCIDNHINYEVIRYDEDVETRMDAIIKKWQAFT